MVYVHANRFLFSKKKNIVYYYYLFFLIIKCVRQNGRRPLAFRLYTVYTTRRRGVRFEGGCVFAYNNIMTILCVNVQFYETNQP